MKETNLIKNYIQNNQLNIEKVIKDFTPYVYTIIQNKNRKLTDEDTEEIISDVFLAVWKNQKTLDISKEMASYLGGITNHIISKKIKNIKNVSDINDYENTLYEIGSIEKQTEQKEKNDLIIQELNKMKQEDKQIFMSYYYYAKTMNEIAKELNLSEQKIKSRLFRIRKKLKKILEKRGYTYHG